jgi:hypothetical protein
VLTNGYRGVKGKNTGSYNRLEKSGNIHKEKFCVRMYSKGRYEPE